MPEGPGEQGSADAAAGPENAAASAVDDALLHSCPALGFATDSASHFLAATSAHRCFAAATVRAVPVEHQTRFCLTGRHVLCPLWIQSPLASAAADGSAGLNGSVQASGVFVAAPEALSRVESEPEVRHFRGLVALAAAVLAMLAVLLVAGLVFAVSRRAGAPRSSAVTPPASNGAVATAPADAPTLVPAAAPDVAPAASPTPPPAESGVQTARLLRNGAVLVTRVDTSLDGSPTGQAIMSSRVPAAGACDRWYLDVLSFDRATASYVNVFDATRAAGADGAPLLPAPAQAGGVCLPQVASVLAPRLDGAGAPLGLATIKLPDGRLRLLAIGMKQGDTQATLYFDTTFAAGSTVAVTGSPVRVQVEQPASGPSVQGVYTPADGSVGILHEQLSGGPGSLLVATPTFSPACATGSVGARAEVNGTRWLRLDCPSSAGTAKSLFMVSTSVKFVPTSLSWESLQAGSRVTVTLDPSSPTPVSAQNVAPLVSGVQIAPQTTPSPTPFSASGFTPPAQTAPVYIPPASVYIPPASVYVPPAPIYVPAAPAYVPAAPTTVDAPSAQPPQPPQPADAATQAPAPTLVQPLNPAPPASPPANTAPVAPVTRPPADPVATSPPATHAPSGGAAPAPTPQPAASDGGGVATPTGDSAAPPPPYVL